MFSGICACVVCCFFFFSGVKMRRTAWFVVQLGVLFVVSLALLLYMYTFIEIREPTKSQSSPFFVDTRSTEELAFGVKRYLKMLRYLDKNVSSPANTTVAERLKSKIRVLCLILTTEETFETRATVVKETWARRCNQFFFIMNTKRKASYIINSPELENRHNLVHKVKFALRYVYDRHMNDFDWLLKADDDTYVIVENLRYLLRQYDSKKPGYLGYHFKKYVDNGFMSGGAGYVMSQSALKQMVDRGFDTGACAVVPVPYDPENSEDLEIGRCMNISGVDVLKSLDDGRETFHPYPIEKYMFGPLEPYLYQWSMYIPQVGPRCCSRYSISFHYVSPENMIFMDHLLYRTSVFGLDGHMDDTSNNNDNKVSI